MADSRLGAPPHSHRRLADSVWGGAEEGYHAIQLFPEGRLGARVRVPLSAARFLKVHGVADGKRTKLIRTAAAAGVAFALLSPRAGGGPTQEGRGSEPLRAPRKLGSHAPLQAYPQVYVPTAGAHTESSASAVVRYTAVAPALSCCERRLQEASESVLPSDPLFKTPSTWP